MNLENKPARVRFAPSPTGRVHLGSARTALFDFLLARQTGGQFILRIEDTDRKRYVPGAEEELINGLHWLGLTWDEGPDVGGPFGPYRQSERKEIYQEYGRMLVESGHAYYCFCTPERLNKIHEGQIEHKEPPHYDGLCRRLDPVEAIRRVLVGEPHVVRFKMPREGVTTIRDVLRGDITVENRTMDDTILIKTDGWALYHLAAAVDDHLMEITHVLRGSEWLPTFPLHALIHRAFGWKEPTWVHLSVFLKPSGKGKMSKREDAELIKDGYSVFVQDLKGLGYIPEGVINWVALMGWSYNDWEEFFTLPDLVQKFSIQKLNPSPAAINFSKLDHFNGLHIRALPIDELALRIRPFLESAGYRVDEEHLKMIAPIVQQRLTTLDDVVDMAGFFFKTDIQQAPERLVSKGLSRLQSAEVAHQVYDLLAALPDLHPATTEPVLRSLIEGSGLSAGQVLGLLREAVTGQQVSPPIFETMEIIGVEKVLNRLLRAIELLEG
ncbi:MAG: glutamate--tRNA ligase [Anaerolineaceae bacterium]|nr:glutamate--tRNA ligase [Anaerolineaceae bacterium]